MATFNLTDLDDIFLEIQSTTGSDIINANGGNDIIFGSFGNDSINGGDGNDRIFETGNNSGGNDNVRGGFGDDTIIDNVGDDSLYGDSGNDLLDAGAGADLIDAGDGNDILFGRDGNDRMLGGRGDDILDGGIGNDILRGGAGLDGQAGGGGFDIYDYDAVSESPGNFFLSDGIGFEAAGAAAGDRIDLSTIDANIGVLGNQAFTFIGTRVPTEGNAAGTVWVTDAVQDDGLPITLVNVSNDADSSPEMLIRANDDVNPSENNAVTATNWVSSDFIL